MTRFDLFMVSLILLLFIYDFIILDGIILVAYLFSILVSKLIGGGKNEN